MQPQEVGLLRSLLVEQRVLSLAVVADDRPVIGLLQFALSADGRALIVHASRLARHTAALAEGARYDPPWKLWLLRRNEIWLELD